MLYLIIVNRFQSNNPVKVTNSTQSSSNESLSLGAFPVSVHIHLTNLLYFSLISLASDQLISLFIACSRSSTNRKHRLTGTIAFPTGNIPTNGPSMHILLISLLERVCLRITSVSVPHLSLPAFFRALKRMNRNAIKQAVIHTILK